MLHITCNFINFINKYKIFVNALFNKILLTKCIKRVFGRIVVTDAVYKEMLYTCYNEGRIQIQFHRCFTLYYRLYDTESMNYFYRRNTPHRHLFLNMFLFRYMQSINLYIVTIKIYIIYNYLFHAQLKNIVFLMKRNITSCKK